MIKFLILCSFFLVSLNSCGSKKKPVLSKVQLIELAVDQKLEIIQRKKEKTCKESALEEALNYVDSLIAKEFALQMIDTIRFPNRPIKPRLPGGKIQLDTSSITPIINK